MEKLFSALLFCITLSTAASTFIPPRPHPHSSPTTTSTDDLETTTLPPSGSEAGTTAASEFDVEPQAVLEGQCSLGTIFSPESSASSFSLPGKLYVNFEEQAPCSGAIIRWELCFTVDEEGTNGTIYFIILRHDQVGEGYEIVSVYGLDFIKGLETAVQCKYRDIEEGAINMREGDFLGFVSFDHIRVALVPSPEGMNGGMLMSYDTTTPQSRSSRSNGGTLEVGNFIDQSEFISSNNQLIPLIRVIIGQLLYS